MQAETQVGALASLAVERIFGPLPGNGLIEILRLGDDGLAITKAEAPRFHEMAISEFTVAMSEDARRKMIRSRSSADTVETGGLLIGSWDRVANVLYVVAATGAPTDSVEAPAGFERGAVDVYRTLERIETITGGNLTYIGEWHSHPPGFDTKPSGDDRILLRWIAGNLEFLDVPPCMVIIGDEEMRIIVRTHRECAISAHER